MEKENKQLNVLEDLKRKDDLKKTIKEIATKEITEQLKSGLFTSRKLTDTPTDSLQVVNRKFVTLNGVTGSRPLSSILGQYYFDTSLAGGNGRPVWYGPNGWVDSDGVAT